MTMIACDRYLADDGLRELVLLDGADGSRLLVDRRETDGTDARLLAHLASDEPDANARLVCSEFLADASRGARRLRATDFGAQPEGDGPGPQPSCVSPGGPHRRRRPALFPALERNARRAALAPRVPPPGWRAALPQRARRRRGARGLRAGLRADSRRRGAVSSRPPGFGLDARRSSCGASSRVRSCSTGGCARLCSTRCSEHGTSFSAIAMACGRIKHDRRGNGSGETSWLARRVGLLPSTPGARPNPWVHSDTLALIARDGLGIAPREVELP